MDPIAVKTEDEVTILTGTSYVTLPRKGRARPGIPPTRPAPRSRDFRRVVEAGARALVVSAGRAFVFVVAPGLWLGAVPAPLDAAEEGPETARGVAVAPADATSQGAEFRQELPGPVVGPEWLAERLADPDLVLLHVGRREEYEEAHLPGARFLDLADVSFSRGATDDPDRVMLDLPPDLATVRSALEAVGVSDGSTVVVSYGEGRATTATRVLWTLEVMGLGARSALLDGGVEAWSASGRETTSAASNASGGRISLEPRLDRRVDKGWVLANLTTPGVAIVDGRRLNSYTGEREELPGRAGHIPGAGSLPIEELFGEDGRLRDPGELRDLFARAGVDAGDTVVAYCHIGLRATAVILAARVAGYDAVLYDGSMMEWARDPGMPLERSGGGS